MKTLEDFIKLPDNTIKDLLKKQEIYTPKDIKHEQLLDYAINKLHGIEFIHNNEKEIKGKITKEIKSLKPITGETCPSCKQKTLRKLKLPTNNSYNGYSYCNYCGLYQSPKKPIEVKA